MTDNFNSIYEIYKDSILVLLQQNGSCTSPKNISCYKCVIISILKKKGLGYKCSMDMEVIKDMIIKEVLPLLTEEEVFELML